MGEATLKHAQPWDYAAGKLDPWVTGAYETAGAPDRRLGLTRGKTYPGLYPTVGAYDDLPLELRRFSKVPALGKRHGVSFRRPQSYGPLEQGLRHRQRASSREKQRPCHSF